MSEKIFDQLNEAYTIENLNRITAIIVEAYRNKQFSKIENLVQKLSGVCRFPDSKINKYFSRLILLYHPDKLNHYRNQLNGYQKSPTNNVLKEMSHILITLEEIDKKTDSDIVEANIMDGFEVEFGFDEEDIDEIESWNEYELDGGISHSEAQTEAYPRDFITLLKIKEFGHTDAVISVIELESLDGILELSGIFMDNLNGIEYCINLKSPDLSDNRITDITKLGYLHSLEEIDLSGNEIDEIEILSNLNNLKSLDLAFNNVKNISSLSDHPGLKYINLVGNPVPDDQIEKLKSAGLMIIF